MNRDSSERRTYNVICCLVTKIIIRKIISTIVNGVDEKMIGLDILAYAEYVFIIHPKDCWCTCMIGSFHYEWTFGPMQLAQSVDIRGIVLIWMFFLMIFVFFLMINNVCVCCARKNKYTHLHVLSDILCLSFTAPKQCNLLTLMSISTKNM